MQRKIATLVMVALVVAALPVAASTFLSKTPEELVADSNAVVTGSVVSVDSFWNENHTVIVTEVVFEVEEAVVGTAPRYVTVRVAGGTVDDYTVTAHGFPTFEPGERALLFVGPDAQVAERLRVVGYQQGHYRIVTNRFGEEIAVPTLDSEVNLVSPRRGAMAAPQAQRLDQFKARLREAARRAPQFTKAQ